MAKHSRSATARESRMSGTLLFFAAILAAWIPLLFLYNQNATYVELSFVLLLGLELSVLFAVGYLVARMLFRSPLAAYLCCIVACLGLYGARTYDGWLHLRAHLNAIANCAVLAGIVLILVCAVGLMFRRRRAATGFVSIVAMMTAIMLVVNAVPIVRRAIDNASVHAIDDDSLYQTEFVTDASQPSPNIFWMHLDGMLGVDAVEKYYGVAQTAFRQALAERGFALNESARLESGHTTALALAALQSPHFYDQYLAEPLSTHDGAMDFKYNVYERRLDVRAAVARARVLDNELYAALARKGYQTRMVSNYSPFYFTLLTNSAYLHDENAYLRYDATQNPTFAQSYMEYLIYQGEALAFSEIVFGPFADVLDPLNTRLGVMRSKKDMLAPIYRGKAVSDAIDVEAAFPTLTDTDWFHRNASILNCFIQSLDGSEPFVDSIYICTEGVHYPFVYNETGMYNGKPDSNRDPSDFYGQYLWTQKLLLAMIDTILAKYPDAVIVLQGDHGLHGSSTTDFEQAFGVQGAQLDMWNSVMSAIRVPDAYRTDDIQYALANPLNITRYLVNTFIGAGNYTYR